MTVFIDWKKISGISKMTEKVGYQQNKNNV